MSYKIKKIRVNEMFRPVGIDIDNPVFAWEFQSDRPAMRQVKAQILTGTEPGGSTCWDSGIMETDCSTGIRYEGTELEPENRYYVTVRTWNETGEEQEAQTFFETGLMDSNIKAWEGARWIGAPEYYLCSDALSVFTLETKLRIEEGYRAGVVFGANDPRLLDKEKNEYLIEGENYIRYVLDVAGIPAKIDVYRVGYSPEDTADTPFASFPVTDITTGEPVITEENRRKEHELKIEVTGNCAYTYIDGVKVDEEERTGYMGAQKCPRQLNPLGAEDTTTFPRLCEIGYYAGRDSKACFDGLRVKNLRHPRNEIASLDTEEGIVLTGENQRTVNPSRHSIPMLRRDFEVKAGVAKARLYATARGIYECSINGKRVGDEYFAPGASQFDKHLMYQTYDVTAYLKEGKNGIGCTLASGWWCDAVTYIVSNYNFWGDKMSFLGKLVITYEDGSREVITTNPQEWQYFGEGPYTYAGFFNGEHYDANRAYIYEEYSKPGFSIDGLKKPEEIRPVPMERIGEPGAFSWPALNTQEPEITGNYNAPVKEVEILTAKAMTEPAKGVYIYDLGQEIAGVPLVKLRGRKGQKVTIRYAEMLYPFLEEYGRLAGRMLQVNLREASNTDIYICGGIGVETYKPKFTFHGFRYIEISGVDPAPALGDVQGILLSSVPEITGRFECSNPLVNKLVSNVSYSQRCNFISIPTDCPQRNERMGWTGDTHVFCRTATYQSQIKNFYLRSLQAMKDLQEENGRLPNIAPFGGGFGGITYESAMILMCWELYQQYGDFSVVEEYYSSMDQWMSALEKAGMPGCLQEFGLGDWLSPDETDRFLIWNAFYYRNARLMSLFAKEMGNREDEEKYNRIAVKTRTYWNDTFVDPATGRTRDGEGNINDTQGGYSIALSCDVFYEEYKDKAFENLARKTRECGCTVRTGFFGTGPLNPMLSAGGYKELAQKVINQTNCPSWLYPVTQGATTVWERWNSYTVENGFGGMNAMNSFNHYSYGCVLNWLYENVLGIQRDESRPGYQHFILKPETGGFVYAKGGIVTPHGRIESSWEYKDGEIRYRCRIPENTTATLIFGDMEKELPGGVYTFTAIV